MKVRLDGKDIQDISLQELKEMQKLINAEIDEFLEKLRDICAWVRKDIKEMRI